MPVCSSAPVRASVRASRSSGSASSPSAGSEPADDLGADHARAAARRRGRCRAARGWRPRPGAGCVPSTVARCRVTRRDPLGAASRPVISAGCSSSTLRWNSSANRWFLRAEVGVRRRRRDARAAGDRADRQRLRPDRGAAPRAAGVEQPLDGLRLAGVEPLPRQGGHLTGHLSNLERVLVPGQGPQMLTARARPRRRSAPAPGAAACGPPASCRTKTPMQHAERDAQLPERGDRGQRAAGLGEQDQPVRRQRDDAPAEPGERLPPGRSRADRAAAARRRRTSGSDPGLEEDQPPGVRHDRSAAGDGEPVDDGVAGDRDAGAERGGDAAAVARG